MMHNTLSQPWGNRLLDALPAATQRALAPALKRVQLARGAVTMHAGRPLEHVDFPVDAVIAITARTPSGKTAEAAAVGSEGYVETDALLEATIAHRSAECRLPGAVWRLPIAAFHTRLKTDPDFVEAIRRASRTRIHLMEQAVLCTAHHTMDQRLARWLLETRDRSGREHFKVTQAELAGVLGVRRAGISLTVARLRRAGAVENERGGMLVTDYERLRKEACECYDVTRGAVAGVLA
jgi:CRP-like cAMP-binding protein